jgi:DNA-binding CsgD family transcriptional regulator
MKLDDLRAIASPLARAKAAEEASKRAAEYQKQCDKLRDAAMREAHAGGKGASYQAIADEVGVSKSTVAGACKT